MALGVPQREIATGLGIRRETLRRRLARAVADSDEHERAQRLAAELRARPGYLATLRVPRGWLAQQLGVHRETLRRRLRKAGVDG